MKRTWNMSVSTKHVILGVGGWRGDVKFGTRGLGISGTFPKYTQHPSQPLYHVHLGSRWLLYVTEKKQVFWGHLFSGVLGST